MSDAGKPHAKAIDLVVNGRKVSALVTPRTHLADFLRERQLLTGTHLGCEHGVCGACTLLLDGQPVRSCITFAVACDGHSITTVEGLNDDELAAQLREAFTAEHGLQCGFCTPGMLVSARDVVLRKPDADNDTIRQEMSGNLCRCTGYVGIVNAIRRVMEARKERRGYPCRKSRGASPSRFRLTRSGASFRIRRGSSPAYPALR